MKWAKIKNSGILIIWEQFGAVFAGISCTQSSYDNLSPWPIPVLKKIPVQKIINQLYMLLL